jgi:hypothetical protein
MTAPAAIANSPATARSPQAVEADHGGDQPDDDVGDARPAALPAGGEALEEPVEPADDQRGAEQDGHDRQRGRRPGQEQDADRQARHRGGRDDHPGATAARGGLGGRREALLGRGTRSGHGASFGSTRPNPPASAASLD